MITPETWALLVFMSSQSAPIPVHKYSGSDAKKVCWEMADQIVAEEPEREKRGRQYSYRLYVACIRVR